MNNWYIDYLVEIRRRDDEIAAAERYRLARPLKTAPARWRLFYARQLNGLGGLLMDWGCRLQSRYESLAAIRVGEIPAPAAPEPCSS